MFLADFGADVRRTEGPEPFVWNRNKSFVADDDSLAAGADVIVLSGTQFARARELHALHRSAVVLHTPPFLGVKRWAGDRESDGLISAWMGIAQRQSSFDGGPIDSICPIATTLQGVWAAACAVAALLERERSARGQIVTVSGEHGAMVGSSGALTFKHADLAAPPPRRSGGPGGSVPFYRTYECADGEWLFFAALIPNFTRIGFDVLGLSDLFDDPRLEGRGRAAMLAPQNATWVTEAIAARFAEAPRDEWVAKLRAAGCPVGAILDRDVWLDHPQVGAIGMRARVDDRTHGAVDMPDIALKLSDTPGAIREAVAFEHWDPRGAANGDGAIADGPLSGVRVLDLGAIIAGPFSASLLGELGADVIKVEPLTGDSFRGPGFAAYNKGQRGIALDLRHADGQEVFHDLVAGADVVIDNYRPGVLRRLGIEWESLARINPNVISASITGFGDGGPFGADAGFDPVLQAMSGMMRSQGGSSDPVFYTVAVNDVAASAVIAFGSVLALFHRARTGRAQSVATSLTAMSVLMQTEALVRYEGRPPAVVGSRDHLGSSAVDRFYRANDGFLRVDEADPQRFDALGIEATDAGIASWASSRTRDDAVAILSGAGIAAIASRTIAEIASDTDMYDWQILQRDPRPDRDGSTAGRYAIFSRTMRRDVLSSPALGEHTRVVLSELGYDDARVNALVDSGGVGAQQP